MPRQNQNRRPEPQCRGARAEPGQEIEARRHLPETGEMVFDDKRRVKSERLGLDIVLDPLAKSLAAVGQLRTRGRPPRLGAAEQSKPHCCCSPSVELRVPLMPIGRLLIGM